MERILSLLKPLGAPLQLEESLLKLDWLIRLRWVAIFAQLACLFLGREFGYLPEDRVLPFGVLVSALIFFNFYSARYVRRRDQVKGRTLFLQVTVDILELTGLLMLSGGFGNPFSSLLLLHSALGPIFLERRHSLGFFVLVALCVGVLQLAARTSLRAEMWFTPNSVVFFSYLIAAFVIWGITTWLTDTLSGLRTNVQRLREQRNRFDRLQAMGAVAAGFSHEFSTPLNTIRLRLERLARKTDGEDTEPALEAVSQCERAIRNMADSEFKVDALTLRDVNFSEFAQESVARWRSVHPDVELNLSPGGLNGTRVRVPILPLTQTLFSVLDNAAEAGKKIQVNLESKDGTVICDVRDDGVGFPDVVLSNWGTPFLTTKSDGTGLGLYNASLVMQAIGGEITVRNLEEGGAGVTLRIPKQSPQEACRV